MYLLQQNKNFNVIIFKPIFLFFSILKIKKTNKEIANGSKDSGAFLLLGKVWIGVCQIIR